MKQTPLEQKISLIVEPVISDLGFALVCVKIIGESGMQNVQIMAENPATKRLGVEDCTAISHAVSAALDVEDPISGRYRLEVSSPGIDRPLVSLADFATYTGFDVKLETDIPTETGQKRFKGKITGIEGENVLMTTDQGDAKIPYASISKAKLVLTDELIKATGPAKTETPEDEDENESSTDEN